MTRIAPDIRAASRRLRAEMTPEERLLWRELRELNRLSGTHFRRQAPVGRYILDFADLGRRLAVEVDGGQHNMPEGVVRDSSREVWLRAQGFTVLRFWNDEVRKNTEGVMQVVLDAVGADDLAERRPPPPTPPDKGEGRRYSSASGASLPPRGGGMGRGGGAPPARGAKGATP